MRPQLLILPRALKELARLPAATQDRIATAVRRLAEIPRPRGSRKLTGRDAWRTRVGDYRVVYEIDDANHVVTILHIGHRRDVYR